MIKKPEAKLIDEDGNIFNLLSIAIKALNFHEQSTEMRNRVFKSHSYDEALGIISEYVDII